jgi:hypothetical protein
VHDQDNFSTFFDFRVDYGPNGFDVCAEVLERWSCTYRAERDVLRFVSGGFEVVAYFLEHGR